AHPNVFWSDCMVAWTESRVRHVLETVATTPEARSGTLLGARLGALIKDDRPRFPPWRTWGSTIVWFLDLETLEVVLVRLEAGGGLPADCQPAQTPERFLAVPPVPQDDLRKVARGCIEKLPSDLRAELNAVIDREAWYPV